MSSKAKIPERLDPGLVVTVPAVFQEFGNLKHTKLVSTDF
jgi:hypothetical protein